MGHTLLEPPPFQEASRCVVCDCSFTTFKRRHHCRSCGKSLCNEHSSNHKALPQFGLYSPVRVCDDCYNYTQPVVSSTTYSSIRAADDVASSVERLDLASEASSLAHEDDGPGDVPEQPAFDCTCGMPLCICEVPAVPKATTPSKFGGPTVKPVKVTSSIVPSPWVARQQSSSNLGSGGMPRPSFSSAQTSFPNNQQAPRTYDRSGEGVREAVKNNDIDAVRALLAQGVDSNYRDRQGMSLLHLAAVFNFTEVVFVLMDAGANVHARNAQGETPLECAQPTLAYKMRQKLGSLVMRSFLASSPTYEQSRIEQSRSEQRAMLETQRVGS